MLMPPILAVAHSTLYATNRHDLRAHRDDVHQQATAILSVVARPKPTIPFGMNSEGACNRYLRLAPFAVKLA